MKDTARLLLLLSSSLVLPGCGRDDDPVSSAEDPLELHPRVLDVSNPAAGPPNIILIVMDDMGLGDIRASGGLTVPASDGSMDIPVLTPAMDALAAQGLALTNFYTMGSTCAPTRSSILSGMFPVRTGFLRACGEGSERGIPNEYESLAEVLQGAGYQTAHFGKWHIGNLDSNGPLANGFMESVHGRGYDGGLYWCYSLQTNGSAPVATVNGTHLTTHLTDQAIAFMNQHASEPFFINLWHLAPHWPYDPPAEYLAKYPGCSMDPDCLTGAACCTMKDDQEESGILDPSYPGCTTDVLYAALLEHADHEIGRLLDALETLELEDETYVLLISDNGPEGKYRSLASMQQALLGYQGGKHHYYEGGVRAPLIVRGPGVPAGATASSVVTTNDFVETFADLGGQPRPETDGQSFLPLLAPGGQLGGPIELIWRGGSDYAYRKGKYKLVKDGTPMAGGQPMPNAPSCPGEGCLFDLELDPFELDPMDPYDPGYQATVDDMLTSHLQFRKQVTQIPFDFTLEHGAGGPSDIVYNEDTGVLFLEGGQAVLEDSDLMRFNDVEFTFHTRLLLGDSTFAESPTAILTRKGAALSVVLRDNGAVRVKMSSPEDPTPLTESGENPACVVDPATVSQDEEGTYHFFMESAANTLVTNAWQNVTLSIDYLAGRYDATLYVSGVEVAKICKMGIFVPINQPLVISPISKPLRDARIKQTQIYLSNFTPSEL